MDVNRRHHCPLNVKGPKSAPHRIACSTLGSVQETPDKPIATYTSTFAAMITRVTGGRVCRKLAKMPRTRESGAMASAAVRALTARHSPHSDPGVDPIENPLKDLPQLGQVGMLWRSSAPRLEACSGKRQSWPESV